MRIADTPFGKETQGKVHTAKRQGVCENTLNPHIDLTVKLHEEFLVLLRYDIAI